MTKLIEDYTTDELSAKIEAIKAKRERTANALKKYEEELEHENSVLQYKLDKAIEALKFYADSDCYKDFGRDSLSEVDEDGGEWAQKVLEEIEK